MICYSEPKLCAGSTETIRTLKFSSDNLSAIADDELVLPTPPLPPTKTNCVFLSLPSDGVVSDRKLLLCKIIGFLCKLPSL